jgi:hypothetical protein
MALKVKFDLDLSAFRRGVAQAKAQVERLATGIKEKVQSTQRSIKTGLEVGGISGDKFGKVAEFIGGFSKLGIIALGAASAIKVLNAAFDRYSESLQNNIDRTKTNSAEMQKAADVDKKRSEQHNKMFDELQKLSAIENKSASEKTQATRLVDRLNRAYKNLGLSINEATGQITGLDGAQKKMLDQQFARQKKYLEMQIKNANQEAAALGKAFKWQTGFWGQTGDVILGGKFATMALDNSKQQMATVDKLAQLYSQLDQLTQDQQAAVDKVAAAKEKREKEADDKFHGARKGDINALADENYMKQYAMEHSELETELERYRRKWQQNGGNDMRYWKYLEAEVRKKHELLALEKELAAKAEEKRKKEAEAAAAKLKKEEEAKRAAEASRRAQEQADKKELSDMQSKLREHQGRRIGNIAVITNSLTARGGFAEGGRISGVAEYNRKMLSYNEQQKRLLNDINKQMQKVTQEI